MAYVKANKSLIGKYVVLTEVKKSMSGFFEKGTKVKITDECERGYTFEDELGNRITEAGYCGFEIA